MATLRSSDSADGSRVALTSDQSLSDYEAYRRGDRFYVKIPAADVPQAEAVRGRGFADVKAQRSGDSTVVSFQLQPGAAAHVEQHSNRLDVVITLPGARSSAVPPSSNISTRSGSSEAMTVSTPRTQRAAAVPAPVPTPGSKAGATSEAIPRLSPTATLAQQTSSAATALPASQPTNTVQLQPSQTASSNLKDRLHYWILLAQLNPIPVSVGAAVLLLLIMMFLFQQRRAKSTRRVHPREGESKAKATVASTKSSATVVTGPQATAVPGVPEDRSSFAVDSVAAAIIPESSYPPGETEREIIEL